jgi:hypothetical protein
LQNGDPLAPWEQDIEQKAGDYAVSTFTGVPGNVHSRFLDLNPPDPNDGW